MDPRDPGTLKVRPGTGADRSAQRIQVIVLLERDLCAIQHHVCCEIDPGALPVDAI